jgi:aminopeptidase-like protein
VLGDSVPVDAVLSLEELRAHVFIHEDPELVPYRTSYWTEQWGFCMSRAQLESLEPGGYHAVVDAELVDGSLTSGELTLEDDRETEFLLSTYVCHPALANDNLSGIVDLWALARTLSCQRLEHTYRLLWSPGTLGPLSWLARNRRQAEPGAERARDLVGRRPRPPRYKKSRRGDAPVDRAARYVLARVADSLVSDWQPRPALGGSARRLVGRRDYAPGRRVQPLPRGRPGHDRMRPWPGS